MGNSQTRFDVSPIELGSSDSRGKALSIMRVTQRTDNYFGIIYLGTNTTVTDVPFIEYRSGGIFLINASNPAPQDVDVCIIDSYKACGTLITQVIDSSTNSPIPLSRINFESPGSACWTYRYRLGSLVTDSSIAVVPQTAESGYKCRISVGDYKETSDNESRCCRSTQVNFSTLSMNQPLSQIYNDFINLSMTQRGTCPMHFSNGYTTNHCNDYMNAWCLTNANTEACIMYLLSQLDQNKSTVDSFISYCSRNLNDTVCEYMAIESRRLGNGEVSDRALINYCTANPKDPNCACYNASIKLPSNFTSNAYIGPIACWYKPCAEQTKVQFLLSEQIKQRRDCTITRCSIDIGNININKNNPSIITLINDCNVSLKNRTQLPKDHPTFFSDPVWNMSYMGLLKVSLFAFLIGLPLVIRN